METETLHSKRRTGITKLIGKSFMAMFLLGVFAEFVVRTQLINWDNPIITLTNIQQSFRLFESGILAFIFIIFLDVVLSVAFYILLDAIHKPIALMMVSLRLIYVAVKGFAIVGLLLARDTYSTAMGIDSSQIEGYATQAMQYLKMHHHGFAVGLIFFGLHLLFLWVLLMRVRGIPKIIIWMLLLAGIGYTLNSLVSFFFDDYDLLKIIIIAIFIIPMTFSELSLGIWLWVKGQKVIPLLKR